MTQKNDGTESITEIRECLKELETTFEKDLAQIRHGLTDHVTQDGVDARASIHQVIKRAVRLGFSKTVFVEDMCKKYGIENQS